VKLSRSCGILLHPTSLPSGRLGDDALAFVDWLAAAGQAWWQVLPLGPPDEVGSPYKSPSAFAGWPGFLADPAATVTAGEVADFVARERYWVEDWAAFAGGDAVGDQVRFEREWRELREYATGRGVHLIGDLPIYVAPGSADHRSHPELFQRDAVAGVPPDEFTDEGQLWGNPLYDWRAVRERGYRWWVERFRRTLELVDLTRVDHFRGFVAYWAVPADATTAKDGAWRPGPGRELFETVREAVGDLPVIAEDLGVITPAVERLREELGLPGMHVMQWAFTDDHASPHRLENHRENGVVYTGTHDNDTAAGWWSTLTPAERAATRLDADDPAWSLIERARGTRDRPRAGRPRPRERGAHEPPRERPGQLALAARAGPADRRARRAPARRCGEERSGVILEAAAAALICLDPGHGTARRVAFEREPIGPGSRTLKVKDPGGAPGEADVVLSIAKRTRALLLARGLRVAMTREREGYAGGNIARARFCNARGAALMLRIHADGSTNATVNGARTLYPARIRGWTDDVYVRSLRAARIVQRALVEETGAHDLGVQRRADLTGFNWADVPVILTETGYLTNPRERRLLRSGAYQARVAHGLATGAVRAMATIRNRG
jgi:4-alpha-glucanotransferase